jgi:mannitol/fructose-specific phosphotransferase system IIA component (Ntr-type)
MRVVDCLAPELIAVAPPWTDFDGTVAGLADLLVAAGRLDPALRTPALAAVRERERASSTTLVEVGIGIPHATVAGLPGVRAALALSPRGLFSAAPLLPVHVVALVLSPPAPRTEHLDLLAALSLLLHAERLRRALLEAPTPAAAFEIIRAAEARGTV